MTGQWYSVDLFVCSKVFSISLLLSFSLLPKMHLTSAAVKCFVYISLLLSFSLLPKTHMLLFLADVFANVSFLLLFGRFSKPHHSLEFPYLRVTLC